MIESDYKFLEHPAPKCDALSLPKFALNLVLGRQKEALREVYLSMVRVIVLHVKLNLHLFKKVIEWLHQVVNEVELVMVHHRWHDYSGWALYLSL